MANLAITASTHTSASILAPFDRTRPARAQNEKRKKERKEQSEKKESTKSHPIGFAELCSGGIERRNAHCWIRQIGKY